MRKKLTHLQGKLQEAIARQAVCTDETTNSDLQAIMKEENQVMKMLPDGSFSVDILGTAKASWCKERSMWCSLAPFDNKVLLVPEASVGKDIRYIT